VIFTIKSCQLNTKFDGENCIEAPVLIAGAFPIRSSSGTLHSENRIEITVYRSLSEAEVTGYEAIQ
jgi:hypothetical protein